LTEKHTIKVRFGADWKRAFGDTDEGVAIPVVFQRIMKVLTNLGTPQKVATMTHEHITEKAGRKWHVRNQGMREHRGSHKRE
jgi:hypothetical protein